MAPVRHSEVHGVWPKGWVLEWSSDRRIVKESLFLHHGELIVAANSEVRSPKTDNRVISDVGKLVNDKSRSSHLLGPVIHGCLSPEKFIIVVSDGVSGDFMTHEVHFLNG